jgi:Uncharacterised nucleotidyltransferase
MAWISDLNPDPQHRGQMHHLLSQCRDIDHLITIALKEGLAGLLYKYLLEAKLLDALSFEQSQRLNNIYYRILSHNVRLTHDLKVVLHRFHQKGIQVVLLQGIDLIQQVYGDLGLRPLTDIDLWVLPGNYPRVVGILKSEGYTRDPLYPNTFKKGATIFDIHTHILWADRIPARKLLFRKGEEEVYRQTGMIHVGDQSARCLSPYDQVVYLSLHVLKHYVDRLIWLVDIRNLLVHWDRSDWTGFSTRVKELGQERTVSYLLFLLSHLLGYRHPPNVRRLEEEHKLHVLEKKILKTRIKGKSLPIWAPVFLFSSGLGFKNRLFFVLESLFPRPEILRQVFAASPDLKVWQLYLKRMLQLFNHKRRI